MTDVAGINTVRQYAKPPDAGNIERSVTEPSGRLGYAYGGVAIPNLHGLTPECKGAFPCSQYRGPP